MVDQMYPRQVGSNTIVYEKDWNQAAPFGYCPACGSIGVEEVEIPGDGDICFVCTDKTCKSVMGQHSATRTAWNQDKPAELLEKEAEGGSWNKDNFTPAKIDEIFNDLYS